MSDNNSTRERGAGTAGQTEEGVKDAEKRVPVGLKAGEPGDTEHVVGAVSQAPQDDEDLPRLKDGDVKIVDGIPTVTEAKAKELREKLG